MVLRDNVIAHINIPLQHIRQHAVASHNIGVIGYIPIIRQSGYTPTGFHLLCVINSPVKCCCRYITIRLHSATVLNRSVFSNRSSNILSCLNTSVEINTAGFRCSAYVSRVCSDHTVYRNISVFNGQIYIATCMDIMFTVRPV